jgi:hypothetical protein
MMYDEADVSLHIFTAELTKKTDQLHGLTALQKGKRAPNTLRITE